VSAPGGASCEAVLYGPDVSAIGRPRTFPELRRGSWTGGGDTGPWERKGEWAESRDLSQVSTSELFSFAFFLSVFNFQF
jgi:hypothetical protein